MSKDKRGKGKKGKKPKRPPGQATFGDVAAGRSDRILDATGLSRNANVVGVGPGLFIRGGGKKIPWTLAGNIVADDVKVDPNSPMQVLPGEAMHFKSLTVGDQQIDELAVTVTSVGSARMATLSQPHQVSTSVEGYESQCTEEEELWFLTKLAQFLERTEAVPHEVGPMQPKGGRDYTDGKIERSGQPDLLFQIVHGFRDKRGALGAVGGIDNASFTTNELQATIDWKAGPDKIDPESKARHFLLLISPLDVGDHFRKALATKPLLSRGFLGVWFCDSVRSPVLVA